MEEKKKNYHIQVAEIGEKRREKLIWAENWRKKKRIVAMELSKNWRGERERERERERENFYFKKIYFAI